MTPERERVMGLIQAAFQGVVLGNGIGLHEGDGLDDYADETTRKMYRDQDEKNDWELIPVENLNRYYCSLSYFDPEGMRFHLPAFIVADIKGTFRFELVSCLTQGAEYDPSKFSLLSPAQRTAIREYLLLVKNDSSYRPDLPHIERSLKGYWAAG